MTLSSAEVRNIHTAVWDQLFHADLDDADIAATAAKAGVAYDVARREVHGAPGLGSLR